MTAPAPTAEQAAREIARLVNRILKLAPIAGVHVGIKINPAKARRSS